VIWFVASVIAGEVILFLVLLAANRAESRWAPTSPGWFYFLLCVGMFAMSGTSFFAYLDTLHKLRRMSAVGQRYLATRDVVATLRDMETGSRGYLLTGRSTYLEPYNRTRDQIEARCTRLRDVYRESDEAPLADRLCALARSKVDEVEEEVRLRKAGRAADAEGLVLTDEGKNTMELVRAAADVLAKRSLDAYNAVKAEIIVLAQMRIWMAGLVAVGSLVQMVLGALAGRLVRPRDAREDGPPVARPDPGWNLSMFA
jgi:CHASE3 domain sensor protein